MKGQEELEAGLAQTIRQAAPEIVREVIKKAKDGSYLHAKFLFELAGIDLVKPQAEDGEDESLAAYLMRELKQPRQEGEAAG